jgi:ribonuclease Z
MTTEVVLTGTGMPIPHPDRAGPGVLVRHGRVALQFDAGRATAMRLAALGIDCADLTAVFVTHHHSDHLTGLADLVLSRWIGLADARDTPLPVVAPRGPSATFVGRMLEPWTDDIEIRRTHSGRTTHPAVALEIFDAPAAPAEVWRRKDVAVSSVRVQHHPVEPAVAYRVDTPAGAVVFSGDTIPCREVEALADGAAVLVHEAMRATLIRATPFHFVADYHADTVALGAMARRAGVPKLVLTHLIPPPASEEQEGVFVAEVRRGGYTGEIVVGHDLLRLTLGA